MLMSLTDKHIDILHIAINAFDAFNSNQCTRSPRARMNDEYLYKFLVHSYRHRRL